VSVCCMCNIQPAANVDVLTKSRKRSHTPVMPVIGQRLEALDGHTSLPAKRRKIGVSFSIQVESRTASGQKIRTDEDRAKRRVRDTNRFEKRRLESEQMQNVARDDDVPEKGKLDTMKVESLDARGNKRRGQRRGLQRRKRLRRESVKNNAIDGAELSKTIDGLRREESKVNSASQLEESKVNSASQHEGSKVNNSASQHEGSKVNSASQHEGAKVNSVHPPHLERKQLIGGSVVDECTDDKASREPATSLPRGSEPIDLSTSFPTSSVSSTRIKVPNSDDGTSPPDSETAATSSARLKISAPTTSRGRSVEMRCETRISGESSVVGGSIERRISVRQAETAFKCKEVHIRKCAGYIHVKLLNQSRSKCVLNPQVCVLLLVLHKRLSGTKCCLKLPLKLVGYLLVIKIHFLEWLRILTKHLFIHINLSIPPFVYLHLVL